jgi:hypothetical protein
MGKKVYISRSCGVPHDVINRGINWKPWIKTFSRAKEMYPKLRAGAKMLAYVKEKEWVVFNITHHDPDGYMASKLLQMFFEDGPVEEGNEPRLYPQQKFFAYSEIKKDAMSSYIYGDIELIASQMPQKSGALIIPTDLRLMGSFCERTFNLSGMIDAPVVSVDHHLRKKTLNVRRRTASGSLEDFFEDYWGPDDANGKAKDMDIEFRNVKDKPFLDINSGSYQIPATFLVYKMLEYASKKVSLKKARFAVKPDEVVPFVAIGLMGDKANLESGGNKPDKRVMAIIEKAYELENDCKINNLKDWMELIGYSLPELSSEVLKSLRGTNSIDDLCESGCIIPTFGKPLSGERRKIIKRLHRQETNRMERSNSYFYEVQPSKIEARGNTYDVSLGVPIINRLSEKNRSGFIAVWVPQVEMDIDGVKKDVYKVYLRRSDGVYNMNNVMRFIKKGEFSQYPTMQGSGAVGDMTFFTKKDLETGLGRFMKKCKKIREDEVRRIVNKSGTGFI